MKRNVFKKLLALTLALCMCLSLAAPAGASWWDLWSTLTDDSASAADDTQDTTSGNYRIVMLDCGRKYFSVENIKKLIDTMSQYGYNQLTLAFGNGGCRFLLEDMSLSFKKADGTEVEMTSETVKSNITAGNSEFNSDSRYLTQDNMDTIITYATNKGIEIVPLLNMPGHATAILHNTSYTSNGNLNVNDETSRNYGYALLKKYVNYFKGKGCKFFHFGADESDFKGDGMTAFLQGCADVITDAGMTPRMFNDPADGTNTIPNSVEITYWYQNGHQSASTLNSNGYSLINTHGRWYYVIKPAQNSETGTKYWQETVNTSAVSVELPVMKQNSWGWIDKNTFYDNNGSSVSSNLGTMFCIWCDASQDSYLTDSQVISENEKYGALYQLEKMAEHYWPNDIKTDTGSTEAPSIKTENDAEPSTSLTTNASQTLTIGQLADWTSSDESVIKLTAVAVADADATGIATYDAETKQTVTATTVTATAVGTGTATITATPKTTGNTATPAMLTVTVADNTTGGTTTKTEDVSLTVGGSKTFTGIDNTVVAGDKITGDDKYIATAEVTKTESTTASVKQNVTSITSGSKYLILPNTPQNNVVTSTTSNGYNGSWTEAQGLLIQSVTISNNNVENLTQYAWTITKSGDKYTVQNSNGKYMNIVGNNSLTLSDTEVKLNVGWSNKKVYFQNDSGCYLNNFGGGNTFASSYKETLGDNDLWTLYELVEESEASTTLTITGTGEGETSVTVGGTTYNINVTAPTVTETVTLIYGGTFTPEGTDITITNGNNVVSFENGVIEAGNADGTATVTSVVNNAGGYVTARRTYTVSVNNIDWSQIDLLNVQLWITNTWVGEDAAPTSLQTVNVSAKDAYSENGVLLKNFVPETGYKKDGSTEVKVTYWKGTILNTAPVQQGADLSGSGTDFTLIRYWNNSWQYYGADGWTNIGSNYVVAYYLQINHVSPEITTGTKDYGNPPTSDPGSNSTNGFTLTSFAVVYPDGTLSRTEQQMYETGMVRGFWGSTGFGIGLVFAENNSTYKISKMTVTWGTNIKNNLESAGWYTRSQTGTYGVDWGVKWNKTTNSAGDEWYDETTYWQAGDSEIPMIDGDKYDLKFNTTDHHAVLILIYLEVVETEDTLSIIYWDDSTNQQITTDPMPIPVVVEENVTFLSIQQKSDVNVGTFTLDDDAHITNSSGAQRKFNKIISTVPGVADNYKSGIYEYVSAEISEDKKTLTLHYDLKKVDSTVSYVVDFGLPLTITDVLSKVTGITDFSTVNYFGVSAAGGLTSGTTGTFGDVTITKQSNNDYTITYTLKKPLTTAVTIPVYYTISNSKQTTAAIQVIPASNVLYEEDFLTESTTIGTSYASWSHTAGSSVPAQQSQQVNGTDSYSVFGYDDAYESSINGNSLGSHWTIDNLTSGNGSKYLTTTFYGTGFDLIGTAGSNTGMVYLSITNGEKTKLCIIDTSYVDGNTTLYQVPLAHIMGLEEEVHTVNVRAAYRKATSAASAASTYSADGGYDVAEDIYAMLDELYMDGFEIDDIELIGFQNDIYSGTYAAETGTTDTQTRPAGTTVTIDGFRVYRSTANENYPTNEQNVQYVNVLDAVKLSGSKVYAEFNGSFELKSRADYEANGGPQNEIYLKMGQSVVFQTSLEKDAEIQITARAVGSGATNLNGTEIGSNTEMYYKVTVGDDGVVTIANMSNKNTDGMLAISNLKVPANTTFTTVTEESLQVASLMLMSYAVGPVEPEAPAEEGFQPEKFDAKVKSVNLFSKKIVTLTVTTSTDVATLTVNGKTLTPTNAWLVKMGWSDTYTYVYVDTVKRSETAEFKIIAKNDDDAEYTATCTG